jgi:hypothetical protein
MQPIAILAARTVALAALALPAAAELQDRREFKTETMSLGQLSVVVDHSSGHQRERLALNGTPITGVEAPHIYIQQALRFHSGPTGIWRLVRLESGDLACPSLWAIVVMDRSGNTATPPFGTCADRLLSAEEVDGTWILTMDRLPRRKDQPPQSFTFDGTSVTASDP